MIKLSSSLLTVFLIIGAVITSSLAVMMISAQATPAPSTTAAPVAVTVRCNRETACYPWSTRGPSCSRGSRLNLRFSGTASPENGVNVSGIPGNVTDMTYAFCPIVDELQAFNLTNFTRLVATAPDESTGGLKTTQLTEKSYLSAIGFGNQTLRTLPPDSSYGKVLIMDNTANGPCSRSGVSGSIGVVNFLVLNVSLRDGNFIYFAGFENPPGNGFVATCNENDVCTIDPTQQCFGDYPGRKMCGKCYSTAQEVADLTMQVWVSYYGTDVNGRTLRSGASNPLNFLKYALVDVYDALSNSYENIKNTQLTRPGLDPDNLGP